MFPSDWWPGLIGSLALIGAIGLGSIGDAQFDRPRNYTDAELVEMDALRVSIASAAHGTEDSSGPPAILPSVIGGETVHPDAAPDGIVGVVVVSFED